MTIQNICNCDLCGAKVEPPQNSGWARVVEIANDGVSISRSLGDLCDQCKIDLRRWVDSQRAARQGRPS